MYRLLLAILLIAQSFGLATVASYSESDPIPICYPCPDGR